MVDFIRAQAGCDADLADQWNALAESVAKGPKTFRGSSLALALAAQDEFDAMFATAEIIADALMLASLRTVLYEQGTNQLVRSFVCVLASVLS